jgi:hypothetical protein
VFLAGLERDNTKRYFDIHRRIDQQQPLEPSRAFVVAIGAELRRRVSDQLRAYADRHTCHSRRRCISSGHRQGADGSAGAAR